MIAGGDTLMLKVHQATFNSDFNRRVAQGKLERKKHDAKLDFDKMLREVVKNVKEDD